MEVEVGVKVSKVRQHQTEGHKRKGCRSHDKQQQQLLLLLLPLTARVDPGGFARQRRHEPPLLQADAPQLGRAAGDD